MVHHIVITMIPHRTFNNEIKKGYILSINKGGGAEEAVITNTLSLQPNPPPPQPLPSAKYNLCLHIALNCSHGVTFPDHRGKCNLTSTSFLDLERIFQKISSTPCSLGGFVSRGRRREKYSIGYHCFSSNINNSFYW